MTNNTGRILIVDSDSLMLFGLTKALHRNFLTVDTATTARQAVRNLDCRRYDLCVVNVHLPDLSGLELMKVIRSYSPETVVTLMAASYLGDPGLSEAITKAVDQGSCFFLAKPFNLSEATELILQALEGKIDPRQGCCLTGEGALETRRKYQRKPFIRMLKFYLHAVHQGEVRWNSWHAITTDICDGGVGLLTKFPLKESQIVCFDEELTGRMGVVAWSMMLDEVTCRAGIRFT